MKKLLLIAFITSFALSDGWVKFWADGSWLARLESFAYHAFYAHGKMDDGNCEVYIDGIKEISGVAKRSKIALELFGLGLKSNGKFDDFGNLRLEFNETIIATSHTDVGFNTQINITDGTKVIIRKGALNNLKIKSNAMPMYELALICAYLAK